MAKQKNFHSKERHDKQLFAVGWLKHKTLFVY
jgi:hypothetical protein